MFIRKCAKSVSDRIRKSDLIAVQQAHSLRVAKLAALQAMAKAMTQIRAKIKANPAATEEQKQAMGLAVSSQVLPIASVPAFTVPLVTVACPERLRQLVSYREATTPDRRAKPAGVKGAEVYVAVLGKDVAFNREVNQTAMRYVGIPTNSPCSVAFTMEDAGKIAWYVLRWIASDGSPGGWSEPVSKMILG